MHSAASRQQLSVFRQPDFLPPCAPLEHVLRRIAQSERVIGSALHGTVAAEALGVPAFSVRSAVKAPLKYQDYSKGTGRPNHPVFDTVDAAVIAATAATALDGPAWSPEALLQAFPRRHLAGGTAPHPHLVNRPRTQLGCRPP